MISLTNFISWFLLATNLPSKIGKSWFKINLKNRLIKSKCNESHDQSAELLPKGLKVKSLTSDLFYFFLQNFKPNWNFANLHDRIGWLFTKRVWYRNYAKFYAVQQTTIRFVSEFWSLTKIWLNHITESVECLPKGITAEKSDFN